MDIIEPKKEQRLRVLLFLWAKSRKKHATNFGDAFA